MAPENIKRELETPYPLSQKEITSFRENGFIKLKSVLSKELMEYMNTTITAEVKRLNTQHLPLDQRDTYGKAFLQIMNIWTQSEPVKEIVFSKRFAKLATDLLEVKGVRLYHDQALYKEAGGGITPWHADQYYWPLSSDKTVTLWAPMQETPNELGPLEFSAKSNHLKTGRDLKIGDESQQMLEDTLKREGFKTIAGPFEVGEVSFHTGWLYHRAGANKSNHMRAVMTVIYMDKDIKLTEPTNENQVEDWKAWLPGAKVGEVVDTRLNPVLYEG
jgi:ectoine hydroxylase-related dioxygenase (phytanoyl-CoA dioxygenase family)